MKTPYDDLALIPSVVAKQVCLEEYTGQELSNPDGVQVAKVESLRIAMTSNQIADFALKSDSHCRAAYRFNFRWFMDCVKKENGRDMLYQWMRHNLAAYLLNRPESKN